MKTKVDKLDVDKLAHVPVDLSKLSNVIKNDAVKKDAYNAKIKNIEDIIPDITNVATNTTLNVITNEVKYEIPSITNLATNASLNAKINEVKNEIPSITTISYYFTTSSYYNLATTTALTAVENKISNVNN